MPAYPLSDPVIAAFVLIPMMLAATLAWATLTAWRRSGATESAARRAAVIVAVDAAAWMALTWVAAMSGILQQWDRTPPPFLLVILGMVVISLILAVWPRRHAHRAVTSRCGHSSPFRASDCRWSSRCMRWSHEASCRSK